MEELSPNLQALDLSFKKEVKACEHYQNGAARLLQPRVVGLSVLQFILHHFCFTYGLSWAADINRIMKANQQFMQQKTENEVVKQARFCLDNFSCSRVKPEGSFAR